MKNLLIVSLTLFGLSAHADSRIITTCAGGEFRVEVAPDQSNARVFQNDQEIDQMGCIVPYFKPFKGGWGNSGWTQLECTGAHLNNLEINANASNGYLYRMRGSLNYGQYSLDCKWQ